MLTERDIELAHPDAFDFVFGNLPEVKRAEFNRHLSSCPHCQKRPRRVQRHRPDHQEPSPARRAASRPRRPDGRRHGRRPGRAEDHDRSPPGRRRPSRHPGLPDSRAPASGRARDPGPAETAAPASGRGRDPAPAIARQNRHRPSRRPGRWSLPCPCGGVIEAASLLSLPRPLPSSPPPSSSRSALAEVGRRLTVAIPLHATAAAKASGFGAATGQATARQDASGSWDITLTVQHLKNFGDAQWYECWYVSRRRGQVASAGTFLVPDSGSGTFSMTSAVDPHDFSTMEITLEPPSKDGALAGTVILSGQTPVAR